MSISTISFNNASRAQIMRVQSELRDALVESSSNRHADVGRVLGRQTANAVTLRSQETSIDRQLQANKIATQRLTVTDDTLESVSGSAQGLRDQLINGLRNSDFLTSATQNARASLDQLVGSMNIAIGGQFLFAGAQTDVRPMSAFGDPDTQGTPAKAVADKFQEFLRAAGKTAASVTGAELDLFFGAGFPSATGPVAFNDLFTDAGWNPTFSNASDAPIQSRISRSETVETSLTANAKAFRDLFAGYAMVTLASETLGADARRSVAAAAQGRLSQGLAGVTALRSDLGNRMARVESADASLKLQKDIAAAQLADLEEVDMVEAANRVATLQTQLEASYRVTGLIREINILDYL